MQGDHKSNSLFYNLTDKQYLKFKLMASVPEVHYLLRNCGAELSEKCIEQKNLTKKLRQDLLPSSWQTKTGSQHNFLSTHIIWMARQSKVSKCKPMLTLRYRHWMVMWRWCKTMDCWFWWSVNENLLRRTQRCRIRCCQSLKLIANFLQT